MHECTHSPSNSADNWQTVLRKQYLRRDPEKNPIGFDASTLRTRTDAYVNSGTASVTTSRRNSVPAQDVEASLDNDQDMRMDELSHEGSEEENAHLIDWLDLPMMSKLDSLYLLTEWQFQNALRLRTTMRNDDEGAEWVS
jgi:hypothetical protein